MSRKNVVGAVEIYGYDPKNPDVKMSPRHAVGHMNTEEAYGAMQLLLTYSVIPAPLLASVVFSSTAVPLAALGGVCVAKAALYLKRKSMLKIRPLDPTKYITPAQAARKLFCTALAAGFLSSGAFYEVATKYRDTPPPKAAPKGYKIVATPFSMLRTPQ